MHPGAVPSPPAGDRPPLLQRGRPGAPAVPRSEDVGLRGRHDDMVPWPDRQGNGHAARGNRQAWGLPPSSRVAAPQERATGLRHGRVDETPSVAWYATAETGAAGIPATRVQVAPRSRLAKRPAFMPASRGPAGSGLAARLRTSASPSAGTGSTAQFATAMRERPGRR
jgi:hypothetical protein